MRRLALPIVLVASLMLPGRADALTIKDLIDLTRAGLGDDILIALIEVDRSVFSIDTETLKQLKDAGVSERVIVAVVRSGRSAAPAPVTAPEPQPDPEPPPAPQVVVIEHREHVREVPVAVPVYVALPAYPRHHYPRHRTTEGTRGVYDITVPARLHPTVVHTAPQPQKAPEPVYWGFGGKLRPDAWKAK